jgi:hypothetical protein
MRLCSRSKRALRLSPMHPSKIRRLSFQHKCASGHFTRHDSRNVSDHSVQDSVVLAQTVDVFDWNTKVKSTSFDLFQFYQDQTDQSIGAVLVSKHPAACWEGSSQSSGIRFGSARCLQ